MTLSFKLACLWIIVTSFIGMLPSRDNHWRVAYVLIAIGLPLLGFVLYENGPWLTLLVLLAAMSILRWPVIYLWRWVKRQIGGQTVPDKED